MSVVGSLGFTWDSPVTLEGLMVQSESRVLLGKERLYGSLEVSSQSYVSYGAPIGMRSDKVWDLGILSSLGFTQTPTYEQVASANVRASGIYVLTTEEMTVTVGLYQFNVDVLNLAFGTGTIRRYNNDTEAVITVGDGCLPISRPIVIATSNINCIQVAGSGVDTQIKAIAVTIYDANCTSGVPWGDINAGALNTIELTFAAKSVLSHERGNRFASVYVV